MSLSKFLAALNRATLTVLVLALLAIPSASTAAPQPPPPLQDSVTGSGFAGPAFCGGDGQVVMNARSGPNGENPTGEARCGELFFGPVTCLSVTGNVALLITGSRSLGPIGVRVTDRGTGIADILEAFPTALAEGGGCPTPLSGYIPLPFTGDLVVIDAPPAPTSKDQCRNGGYIGYGFMNQGQCVAFVERGPKP
jgi:hypothetical protein